MIGVLLITEKIMGKPQSTTIQIQRRGLWSREMTIGQFIKKSSENSDIEAVLIKETVSKKEALEILKMSK